MARCNLLNMSLKMCHMTIDHDKYNDNLSCVNVLMMMFILCTVIRIRQRKIDNKQ